MNKLLVLLAWMIFASAFTACGKKDTSDTIDGSKGYLTGTVKDEQGNTLKGVVVQADNTMFYNSFVLGTTDAEGKYKIKLTRGGAYMAHAWLNKDYNGKTYKLYLHPDNTLGFTDEGAVVNFIWKLKGKKPQPLVNYYGGIVLIDKIPGSTLYDSENIEFTLVPQGLLIDGSQGETIKIRHGQPGTDEYGKLTDIPIGRYIISAVYLTENKPLKLRNQYDPSSTHAVEQVIDFLPESRDGDNMASLEYAE